MARIVSCGSRVRNRLSLELPSEVVDLFMVELSSGATLNESGMVL